MTRPLLISTLLSFIAAIILVTTEYAVTATLMLLPLSVLGCVAVTEGVLAKRDFYIHLLLLKAGENPFLRRFSLVLFWLLLVYTLYGLAPGNWLTTANSPA